MFDSGKIQYDSKYKNVNIANFISNYFRSRTLVVGLYFYFSIPIHKCFHQFWVAPVLLLMMYIPEEISSEHRLDCNIR